MKTYARMQDSVVAEIIAPTTYDNGDEVPIEERFTAELVTTFIDVTSAVPMPAQKWTFSEASSVFSAPVTPAPTSAQILAANTAQRDALMAVSDARTLGMSDAYVAGLLSAIDAATFKACASYKLGLSKVDLTVQSPAWPAIPT
jgi:hypothetical protein